MEYKTFDFESKSFREDDEYYYFEGYLSTFGNVDHGNDIIQRGAFTESLKTHNPSLFWSHNQDQPLGIFEKAIEDDHGLLVFGKMPKTDTFVKDRIVPQMKIGSIKSMSVGFSIEDEKDTEYSKGIRTIKKLKLWEGSLVTIPMNDKATVKSIMPDLPVAQRKTTWDEASALKRNTEEKAFIQAKGEKLLIADIIDGKLTVIPKALFAAAAKINRTDDEVAKSTVTEYYEKIGLDSPYDKSFRIDDFKDFNERSLERLFCDGVSLSRKNAKTIVSFIKKGLAVDGQEKQCDAEWKNILKTINNLNIGLKHGDTRRD